MEYGAGVDRHFTAFTKRSREPDDSPGKIVHFTGASKYFYLFNQIFILME